ncbi:MAG TPA: hypothetical protein PL117_02550 [Accumulibacter sp.]|uniref:hypothetical protein n=1 Tax=Accumulibacter sp. TaxID=2053492 RepID=UPI002C77570A|nr:hypothetical protein [Accumulibacter sp.]HRF71627.1 hypothetical protein [Accumulibacter sp.]
MTRRALGRYDQAHQGVTKSTLAGKDINMKLTWRLAETAMAMALSAQPAWAGLTVYIPPGSANKVIAVDAASNRITARLYVSSRKEPMISVGDQTSLGLLDPIQLPCGEGHQLAIVP